MSDLPQGDPEKDVIPEAPSEEPAPEPKPQEVDVTALQEELRQTKENYANMQKATHEARGETKVFREENQELKTRLAEIAEPKPESQQQYDPDDFANVGTVQQIAQQVVAQEVQKLQAQRVKEQKAQQELAVNVQQMQTQHEDYDEVVRNIAPYLQQNPTIAEGFMQDPATAATKLYDLSKRFMGQLEKRATADAIANPVKQPGTLNQPGRSTPNPYAKRDMSNMTMEEASRILAEAHKAGPDAVAKLIGES